ncbi:MAG: hypothetical protein ACYSUS_00980 [Planctomycetota bacterium]
MKPKILLVNPPIFDFAAYDFWLKPYGMLRVGGLLKPIAELSLFDYMDRLHPAFDSAAKAKTDIYSKGPYPYERIPNPAPLKDIPRYYRRSGMPRQIFQDFLSKNGPYDAILIQTVMTYWYLGVAEVIDDVRQYCIAQMPKSSLAAFTQPPALSMRRILDRTRLLPARTSNHSGN